MPTSTAPRYNALMATIAQDLAVAHRAPGLNEGAGTVTDNVVPLSRASVLTERPKAPETDWVLTISESRSVGRWNLRAWRNGLVMNRPDLTTEQVQSFDCAAEWAKGLENRRGKR